MDKVEKATAAIAEKRKLPEEIKAKLNNYTFVNLIISIALMMYMIVINIIFLNEDTQFFSISIKVFSICLAIIDVLVFEIGYRKDDLRLWIHGFELLSCSILILSLQYIYLYANILVKAIFMLFPIFYLIYYVVKITLVHVIEIKKYQNNLSDVKEIVKNEEEGYLDDIKESVINDVNSIEEIKKQEKEIIKKAKKNKKGRNK